MAHLTGLDQFLQRIQCFRNRDGVRVFIMNIAGGSELVHRAVRPVQLVEVDIVCLQALQAVFNGFKDVLFVEPVFAAANMLDEARS